jgi:hypothetical protein
VGDSEPDWTKDDGIDKAAKKAAKKARQKADAAAKKDTERLAVQETMPAIPENEEAQQMFKAIVTCRVVDPDAKLDWPVTKCSSSSCNHAEKWHKMRSWKVWTNEQMPDDVMQRNIAKFKEGAPPSPEAGTALSVCRGAGKVEGGGGGTASSASSSASNGTSSSPPPPPPPPPGTTGLCWYKWLYQCVCCVAAERGITLAEAKSAMMAEDPNHQAKLERSSNFKRVMEMKASEFNITMVSGSWKTVRKMSLEFMIELLQPLSTFILRKQRALEQLGSDVEEAKLLQLELTGCSDAKRASQIIEALEKYREKGDHYIAFQGREDQHKLIFAASYSDTWSEVAGLGALRAWYLCRRKTGETVCAMAVLSKTWKRLKEDAMATGQRWYCPACGALYKTSAGMLVEISRINASGKIEATYGHADVPPWDLEDVRAAAYEEKAIKERREINTETIFAMASVAAPQTNELVRPALPSEMYTGNSTEGCFKILDLQRIDSLPEWDWWALLGMVKPEKKSRRR